LRRLSSQANADRKINLSWAPEKQNRKPRKGHNDMARPKKDPSETAISIINIRVSKMLKDKFQIKSIRDGGMSKVLIKFIENYVTH